ncbi:hypothetical protein D5R81_05790 [Parashewanella spongiae]|uniref:S1/P1 Nuclease n=1 Tax=Parashewanella spongiae TaxID=342950 RepID=A0A3A6U2N9_9GAMM|nr:S1/P1 nuclease [Parashewanella spongiae]MCL1077342.1 S1/P1 nuclease [Parashewanella spongiae]RJY18309.1 hypothetical protein D5R81_05790 [Parashewanella spongiae]
MRKLAVVLFTSLVVFLTCFEVSAFGRNGHRIVAEIAEQYLTVNAHAQLMKITSGIPLARLSTWPDEIKSDKNWRHASAWHYINVEDDADWEKLPRSSAGDILEALERFENQLSDSSLSNEKRWQALAFLIHFMGDLHQPLHVSRAADKGGTSIPVKWFGETNRYNFHNVWDTLIIEHQQLSYTEYVDFLPISHKNRQSWILGDYTDWAKESMVLRNKVYDYRVDGSGKPDLGYGYIFKHRSEVEQRMQQAGIRLANILNNIFAS